MNMNRILRTVLMITLSMMLAMGVGGVVSIPKVAAAGIDSISIDYFPTYIPTDAAIPCSSGGGTPFAIRITVAGVANQNFVVKARLGTGACTWRPDNSTWTTDSTTFTSLTRGTIGADGTVSMWLYVRANTNATTSLTVRGRGCDATWSTCADSIDASAQTVTLMNMTASGGWLEETLGTARAGRTVVVKSGTSIVGMYAAEDNGVNEGYAYTAGGYKVAVPDCTGCGYTVETWDLATPNVAVDQVNTMGTGSCPSDVSVGGTTSLNACDTPTAVTFSGLSAASPFAALAVGLLAATGLVVLRKRK